MIQNNSGLLPLGRAVLVRPYTPERVGSIIELPADIAVRDQMVEQRAVVVAIGPTAWHDEPMARAAVGDKVLLSRYSGYMAEGTADKQQYRFVNDRDIFAKIEMEN